MATKKRNSGKGKDRNGADEWGDGRAWDFNQFLPAWTLPEGERLDTSQTALFSTDLNGQAQQFLPVYVNNNEQANSFYSIVLALDAEDTEVGFSQETYVLKESWDPIAGDAPVFFLTAPIDDPEYLSPAELADYKVKTFLVNGNSKPFNTPKLLAGGTFREATIIIEDAQSPLPIQLGAGNDVVPGSGIINTSGINIIYAGAGDDQINSGANNDVIRGEHGNDVLQGGNGKDRLFGEAGADLLRGGASNEGYAEADYLNGGSGNDRLYGEGQHDILDGMGGDDILYGDHENENLNNPVHDIFYDEDDLLYGGSGNDILYGGADRDKLFGGDGDDYLVGGAGEDELGGDAGADRFDFYGFAGEQSGYDYIRDFNIAEDKIGIYVGAGSIFRNVGLAVNASVAVSQFHIGENATNPLHRFIFNSDPFYSSSLYFDPDGSGIAPQVELVSIAKVYTNDSYITPNFTAANIITFNDANRRPAPSSPALPSPTVQFAQALYQVNENGGSSIITLTRSNRANGVSQVQVNVTGGTASSSDYNASGLPPTVTFGIGETSKTIAIPIVQDAQLESTESITFSLSSINNPAIGTIETAIGSVNTAKLEIFDDDRPITFTGTRRKDRLIGNELDNLMVGYGGNDILSGESGRDRLFGGRGSDTLKGGADPDIFVLETGAGRDLIQDFRDRQDKFGLTSGMKFKQLSITQQGQDTLISISRHGDQIALLANVRANFITKADFTSL
jgi:Ca2+-binding RTX toxin-like protein